MVDGDLFDKLARIGSLLRKSVEPFGGIQVCFFAMQSIHIFDVVLCLDHRHRRFLSASACYQGHGPSQICVRGRDVE